MVVPCASLENKIVAFVLGPSMEAFRVFCITRVPDGYNIVQRKGLFSFTAFVVKKKNVKYWW